MRYFYLFLVAFLLVGAAKLKGQNNKIDIQGTVVDSAQVPLVGATVLLTNSNDSTLASYSVTDANGSFELPNIKKNEYFIQITYVGYRPFRQNIDWPDAALLEFENIQLLPSSQNLEMVEVAADRVPLRFKNDTIEYNAKAFKTRPNAVVEDLLRQLPGVEVEEDGSIRAQGENVSKVLVDGKEFFGNDPQIATKNLPADAIDKVEVFDKKSKQAEFTGVDDGQEQKTINLALKEDKKKGIFGNAMAGYSDQGRFQAKTSINRFSKKQQISFIGLGNNVNEKGFSIGDYINLMGGIQKLSSGGSFRLELNNPMALGLPLNVGSNDGFITTWSGGLNFNQDFSEKTKMTSSYFYSNINNDIFQTTERSTFFDDFTLSTTNNTQQDSRNENHRINLTLTHQFNDKQSLELTSSANLGNTDAITRSENQQNGQKAVVSNSNQRTNTYQQSQQRLSTALLYRLKFNKKGRTFSGNLSFNLGDNDLDGKLNAFQSFVSDDQIETTDTIQQRSDQTNIQLGYGLRLSYTEPIFKGSILELAVNANVNEDDFDRSVFDLIESQEEFNNDLSNRYDNQISYYRGEMNFKWAKKDFTLTAGVGAQQTQLNGEFLLTNTNIDRQFLNWLPTLRMAYDFASTKKLSFSYNTRINEPDIQQLQPIIDNTDPFNIFQGNPELMPEYSHRLATSFFLFDQFSATNFFLSADFTYTRNKIKTAQDVDEQLIRTSMPINVDDDYVFSTYTSLSIYFKPLKVKLNVNSNVNYNRGITFVNAIENLTNRVTWTNGFRIDNKNKEKLDWTLGSTISWTIAEYSINAELNQDYVNHSYFFDLGFEFLKIFRFQNNFDFNIYSGIGDAETQIVPLWNASISTFFLKDKRGELKLAVRDILNQNIGIQRTADLNFIQEQRINSMARYFMLSFTFQLRGMGGNAKGIKINIDKR